MSERAPDVSVVVPTRDRPEALRRCLAAIEAQDGPALEIVVVDDGSRDGEAVRSAARSVKGATLLQGTDAGPAAARNAGVAAARAPVVLMTDDDCEPAPGWAVLLAEASRAGPAAGPTVNVAPGAAAAAAQAITDHLRASSGTPGGSGLAFAPTSNLGAPRDLLQRLPFDESYPLAAGEDRDWCSRLTRARHRITWVPDARVAHRHQLDALGFIHQQLRYGRGAARFHASGPPPDAHRVRPALYAGFARAGFARGLAPGALVLAGQVATALGFALERASGPRGD